ncbi:nuclear transport factor 2 family protein [Nocardia sp. NPDC050408]|uniref:nuclear transport factor 2 family protein n=1 Tax=Nocardia sp. NPDC050408 TaxID=3364319 RepID=UPI0037B9B6E8
MRASEATLKFLTRYYDAIESADRDRISSYYTEDITLTFGNDPAIHGREKLLEVFIPILRRVRSLHHDIANAWEDGDVIIVEAIGVWNLLDGRSVSANAVDIFVLTDGRFAEHRMVADNTPLFSALEG